jgi:hypothetical protein
MGGVRGNWTARIPSLNLHFVGRFTGDEAALRIEHRELLALPKLLALAPTEAPALLGRRLRPITDNSVGFAYLRRHGGRVDTLRSIYRSAALAAAELDIELANPRWVPSRYNPADRGTRWAVDRDDWGPTSAVRRLIDAWYGVHTVDAMASTETARCSSFVSRFHETGASGTDFFNWSPSPSDNVYLCPPIVTLDEVAERVTRWATPTTLVVPHWPYTTWWHTLQRCAPVVRLVGRAATALCAGPLSGRLPYQSHAWDVAVLRLSGPSSRS